MSEILWAEAALGREAEEFLSSEIGRYIVGRCEQEIQEAQDALATVSPWRRNRIKQLQNEIWRARSVRQWVAELVIQGREAEKQLEQDRDEE